MLKGSLKWEAQFLLPLASSKSGGSVAKRKDSKGSDHDVTVIVLNPCIQCIRSVLESLDRPVQ